MPQCEMCGAERPSLTATKVEGAELELCEDCTEFGTTVRTESESTTSTKYSTGSGGSGTGSSSSGGGGSGGSTGGRSGGGGSGGRRDMFDDVEDLATDYDERVREAREAAGLSQEDLAEQLNEKASLIRKVERGEMLPSDSVQTKLERALDVSLSAGGADGDAEWEGGSSTTTTLGDVVKRKD